MMKGLFWRIAYARDCDLAGRLLLRHAYSRFKPLPVFVHQGNHGDGNLANVRGQGGDIVVGLLGPGIENVILLQGREPFGFIGWQRGVFHISMAFNAATNRDRRRQGSNGSPQGIMAGRSR